MIRAAHERSEAMEEGNYYVWSEKNRIIESIKMIVSQFESGSIPKTVDDYNLDNVSLKVSRIILSHIDYVNRTVWKKNNSTRMI